MARFPTGTPRKRIDCTNMKKSKILGQVYTPNWIVTTILDEMGYFGKDILKKNILEPACGDGAFLCEIVKRYIFEAKKEGVSTKEIAEGLGNNIYGIEIDVEAYKACINNLNQILEDSFSDKVYVDWKIFNENTLYFYQKYLNSFDYVVGNPPYIRIHNLDLETREYLKQNFVFSTGTIDIYLAFFELGFKVLNADGKLGYITPNSFLHNTSYRDFRDFLGKEKNIKILIDFKSNKIFQGFSTYTAITIIDKSQRKDFFEYKELTDGINFIKSLNRIRFKDLDSKKWSFSSEEDEKFLQELFKNKNSALKDFFDVQYGFATLRDKIFISNIKEVDTDHCEFNGSIIEKGLLKKIVKGSRYKGNEEDIAWVLFPYQLKSNRYVAITEEELAEKYPKTYQYLLDNKKNLEERDLDKGVMWYEFGRSQGIQTIHQEKIILSTLVNGKIDFHKLPKDVLMYSGIFITKNSNFSDWEIIENVLKSEEFYKYIRITGKDFSGGYKSINTKQIKEYKINIKNPQLLF